jgi:hypothetical protein
MPEFHYTFSQNSFGQGQDHSSDRFAKGAWTSAHIQRQIRELTKYPGKHKPALKKINDYFMKNIRRMQHATFKHLNIPTDDCNP